MREAFQFSMNTVSLPSAMLSPPWHLTGSLMRAAFGMPGPVNTVCAPSAMSPALGAATWLPTVSPTPSTINVEVITVLAAPATSMVPPTTPAAASAGSEMGAVSATMATPRATPARAPRIPPPRRCECRTGSPTRAAGSSMAHLSLNRAVASTRVISFSQSSEFRA